MIFKYHLNSSLIRKATLTILIVLTFVKPSDGQLKISLEQAIDSTLKNSLQIKHAILKSSISELNLKKSKYSLLPSLNASPQSNLNFGRSLDVSTNNFVTQRVFLINGTLSAQMQLFHGGQLRQQIIENKILLETDKTNINKVKNDLLLSVMTAFLRVLNDGDLLATAKQQVKLANMIVEMVQKAKNAGSKSFADLAQAKSQVTNAELNYNDIESQLETSLLSLKQIMEINSEKNIELIRPDISKLTNVTFNPDTSDLISKALKVNPTLQVANLQKEASLREIHIAGSNFFPGVYLQSSIGSNFSNARTLTLGQEIVGAETIGILKGTNLDVIAPVYAPITAKYPFKRQFSDNFYQSIGIAVQIPLFNTLSNRINLRKAKINFEDSKITYEETKRDLSKVLTQAIHDVESAYKKLNISANNYEYTMQSYQASEKRFKLGVINSIEFNTALNNFNKAEFELIQAKYNYIFRNKIIDYYLGKPISL